MRITWYWPDKGTEDHILSGDFYLTLATRTPEYAVVRDSRRHYSVCRVDFDAEEDADLDRLAFMETMVRASELRYAERYGK